MDPDCSYTYCTVPFSFILYKDCKHCQINYFSAMLKILITWHFVSQSTPPKQIILFEFLKSLECTYKRTQHMKSLDSKLTISWTWDFYEACKDCCVALQGVVRSQAGDRGRQGPDISGDLLSSSWLLAFSLSSLLGPIKPRMNPDCVNVKIQSESYLLHSGSLIIVTATIYWLWVLCFGPVIWTAYSYHAFDKWSVLIGRGLQI